MMKTETIEYRSAGQMHRGFAAWPEGKGPWPLVLVVHNWAGCIDFFHDKARAMAELGYLGFAVDMYGDGKTGDDVSQKEALMNPLIEDRVELRLRIDAALKAGLGLAGADAGKVAGIGFCFGGLVLLDLARSGADVTGVVSFHGIFSPAPIPNEKITAKVLALHGEQDPMVPPEQVNAFQQEMTKAGADWQLHSYGHAGHAFTDPTANNPEMGLLYNPLADSRSWLAMRNFLNEIFA